MLSSSFALYDNVVNVDFHSSTDQRLENFCHQPLGGSTSIIESERHEFVIIQPLQCNKGCILLIRLEHRDFMVSGEDV